MQKRVVFFLSFVVWSSCAGRCSSLRSFDTSGLPDTLSLDAPAGYEWKRVLIHMHSPFSYDACDKNPNRPDGFVNQECLAHFRSALCEQRVDWVFVTDHPKNMIFFDFSALFLESPGRDTLFLPYANQLGGCSNGHHPWLSVGMEANLIAIGMQSHWGMTPAERDKNYGGEDHPTREGLVAQTQALVLLPHSERKTWTVERITQVAPHGIEIYNIHANLDPKIRAADLDWSPFSRLADLLVHLVDPWGEFKPRFSFLAFLEVHPVYFEKWDALIANYQTDPTQPKIFGYGATDSHENVFPQKASDGLRFDAHHRLVQLLSNHFLVPLSTPSQTPLQKFQALLASIQNGRGWEVFEGFGTPLGLHFYAQQGSTLFLPGDELSLLGGSVQLGVALPRLHPASWPAQILRSRPQSAWERKKRPWGAPPRFSLRLKRLQGGPSPISEWVQQTEDQLIYGTVTQAGAYRAEVWIHPRHLISEVGFLRPEADHWHLWAVSNPIYIRP